MQGGNRQQLWYFEEGGLGSGKKAAEVTGPEGKGNRVFQEMAVAVMPRQVTAAAMTAWQAAISGAASKNSSSDAPPGDSGSNDSLAGGNSSIGLPPFVPELL